MVGIPSISMSPDYPHSKDIASTNGTAPSQPLVHRFAISFARHLGAPALFAVLTLVSAATQSHGTSCVAFPPVVATALCKDGVCSEGFGIDHVSTGYGCGRRAAVRELSEAELGLFAASGRHSHHRRLSGVYEAVIDSSCLGRTWWESRCTPPTSIRMLSESLDPQALYAFRSERLRTERQALRSYRIELSIIATIWLVFTILVIGWPWALGSLFSGFRRRIGWALLVAIPIQFFTGLCLAAYAWLLGSVPMTLMVSGTFCAIAIGIAIPVQLGILMRGRWQRLIFCA